MGAVIAFFVSRIPAVAVWVVVASGLATALAMFVLLMAIAVTSDSRLLALRSQFPDAVVVNIRRDPSLLNDLATATERVFETSRVGWLLSMVANRDGISFWTGKSSPSMLASIPWGAIGDIELSTPFKADTYGSMAYSRLRIEITSGSGSSRISFGVDRVTRGYSGFQSLDESQLLELAMSMNALRGRTTAPRTINTVKGLEPGPTAWSLSRFGPLPTLALSWVAQVIALIGVLGVVVLRAPILLLWITFGIALILYLAMAVRLKAAARAMDREKAAGYTTLNGGQLALEQRHPITGVVLRAPGARALSKQEFADHLGRP